MSNVEGEKNMEIGPNCILANRSIAEVKIDVHKRKPSQSPTTAVVANRMAQGLHSLDRLI